MAMLLLASCARRSSPTGGEKDSIPPVLIAANPKINSVNFNTDEIRLTFNEWVKLENLEKQLIISPPLEKKKYEINPLSGITKKIFINFIDSKNNKQPQLRSKFPNRSFSLLLFISDIILKVIKMSK